MITSVRSSLALVVLLALMGQYLAADEGLSRVKISKIGKPGTALVEVKPRNSYGSAFCIHPSGLFLTNEHVVHPDGTFAPNVPLPRVEITLILNPGLKKEKAYPARVVRFDKELDLALLRVESAKEDFPPLSLGLDENLEEQMDVVAFGFPFGQALALNRREFPPVSVNAGSRSQSGDAGNNHREQPQSTTSDAQFHGRSSRASQYVPFERDAVKLIPGQSYSSSQPARVESNIFASTEREDASSDERKR